MSCTRMRAVWLLSAGLTLAGLLVNASSAEACTCVRSRERTGCELRQSEVIFVGKAIEYVRNPRGEHAGGSSVLRISVLEAFKGILPGETTVSNIQYDGDTCIRGFELGVTYVVHADREDDGSISVFICADTTPLAETPSRVIDDLRRMRAGKGTPAVIGTLTRVREAADDSGMRGIRVTASKDGRIHRAITDLAGGFRIDVPAGGVYEVAADLPAGTVLGPDRDAGPVHRVAVEPLACTFTELYAVDDTRIRGRLLLPSGTPAARVTVHLLLPGAEGFWEETASGPDGVFEFVGIKRGTYEVGVNTPCRSQSDVPFDPTFYPGVPDRAHARRYHVTRARRIDAGDLTISAVPPGTRARC